MERRSRLASAVLVVVLGAVSACGDAVDDDTASGGTTERGEDATETTTTVVKSTSTTGPSTTSSSTSTSSTSTSSTSSSTSSSAPQAQPQLSIRAVTLVRGAPGLTTCQLAVAVRNEGGDAADEVVVRARVETVSLPTNSATLTLEGPQGLGPGQQSRYVATVSFAFRQGDLMRYDAEVSSGGTVIDSAASSVGIECTG